MAGTLDLVVLASYANEGVPQSLLQAMAMARPVVGTTCGGIPEIVATGVNGLLVPPKDSDALAQALLDLIRDPATRREVRRPGPEAGAGALFPGTDGRSHGKSLCRHRLISHDEPSVQQFFNRYFLFALSLTNKEIFRS